MAHPDWNQSYTSGERPPWDTGAVDAHLMELWNAGRLRKGRAFMARDGES